MTPVSMRTLLDSGTGRLLGRTYSPPLSKTHYESVQRFEQHASNPAPTGNPSRKSSVIPGALWGSPDPRFSVKELKELRQLARLQIASFLHHELPIRFAHRIRDLDRLPYGLSEMPTVRAIQDQYCRSGVELQEMQVS